MSRPDTKSGVLALIAILASNPTEADVATVQTRLQQMHDGDEFDHEPSGHQPNIQISVDGQTVQVAYDEDGNVSGFEGATTTSGNSEGQTFSYEDVGGLSDYAAGVQSQDEGRGTVLPDPNAPSYNPEVEGIVINGGNQTPPTQPQAVSVGGRTGVDPGAQHYDETDRGAGEAHAEAGENKAPVDEDSAKDEGSKEILPTGVSQDNIDQQEAYQDSLPPDAKVDGTDEAMAHAKAGKKSKTDKADDKADLEI